MLHPQIVHVTNVNKHVLALMVNGSLQMVVGPLIYEAYAKPLHDTNNAWEILA